MQTLRLSNGQQLAYREISGDSRLPVLVFLHEGLGSTAMWKNFPSELCNATGCTGLIYDRLGYGLSDPLNTSFEMDYLHDYAYLELPQVLDQIVGSRQYILVGHSDGGSIALLHAAQRPDNLLGCITLAAHVLVEDITIAGILQAGQAWADGKLTGLEKYHAQQTTQVFNRWFNIWTAAKFRDWNIESCLYRIDTPLLVIQGEDDQYATLRQVDRIVEGAASESHAAIIQNSRHSPHLDAEHLTLKFCREYIRELIHDQT